MVTSTTPPKNAFVAGARKVYNPLGFSKGYNFVLWFIFVGALFGFTLSRFMYLNFNIFCSGKPGATGAAPGECYYYVNYSTKKIGILLHLGTILPACLIVCLQFTPAIRHKAIILHRIGGYVALLLFFVSQAGVFMITRHAFGGGIDIQSAVYVISIMSMGSFVISYVNIKRLQIEQHRAWMMRGWVYASCIITNRIVLIIGAQVISAIGSYYTVWPCAKIAFTINNDEQTASLYPECAPYLNGTSPNQQATVHASFGTTGVETGAALNMTFGTALWVALALHAFGVELYLHLTPREAERLRNVSYQRQVEAGIYRKPGSAGLTSDKLGDADEWVPSSSKKSRDGK